MKNRLLILLLTVSITQVSYAQWSAGALAGLGHIVQRQVSLTSDYGPVFGVEPVQPLKMVGVYGQFATHGKRVLLTGLQLRYQYQRQTHGNYDYLVFSPYIGTHFFKKLEVTAGPEISALLHVGQSKPPLYNSYPTKLVVGLNIKATYWLGRFGAEGGYSYQTTAFNREEYKLSQRTASFDFYNSYAYGVLKYRFTH